MVAGIPATIKKKINLKVQRNIMISKKDVA